MTNLNETHSADVVIAQSGPTPTRAIWIDGDVVANIRIGLALDTFVAGASARGMSVYDAESEQFLCGALAQLSD